MLLKKILHLKTKITEIYSDFENIKKSNVIINNKIEKLEQENDKLKNILSQTLSDMSVISLALKDVYVLLGVIPQDLEPLEEDYYIDDITDELELDDDIYFYKNKDKKKKETIH